MEGSTSGEIESTQGEIEMNIKTNILARDGVAWGAGQIGAGARLELGEWRPDCRTDGSGGQIGGWECQVRWEQRSGESGRLRVG